MRAQRPVAQGAMLPVPHGRLRRTRFSRSRTLCSPRDRNYSQDNSTRSITIQYRNPKLAKFTYLTYESSYQDYECPHAERT